jgi:hypothetical protein
MMARQDFYVRYQSLRGGQNLITDDLLKKLDFACARAPLPFDSTGDVTG